MYWQIKSISNGIYIVSFYYLHYFVSLMSSLLWYRQNLFYNTNKITFQKYDRAVYNNIVILQLDYTKSYCISNFRQDINEEKPQTDLFHNIINNIEKSLIERQHIMIYTICCYLKVFFPVSSQNLLSYLFNYIEYLMV